MCESLLACDCMCLLACCSGAGKVVKVNGRGCINMATLNFLGFNGNKDIEVKKIFFKEEIAVKQTDEEKHCGLLFKNTI